MQDKQGHWWSVRIRPYKTTDHKIDGAVIALLDIDAIKVKGVFGSDGYKLAEAMAEVSASPMMILDKNLEVKAINDAFCKILKTTSDETIGRRIYDLSNQRWNTPRLPIMLTAALKQNDGSDGFQMECEFPTAGKRKLLLSGRRFALDDKLGEIVLLSLKDE